MLSGMLYFEHVEASQWPAAAYPGGRSLHARPCRSASSSMRAAVLHRLARLCRKALPLTTKEVLAAAQMISAIPEESGRMVFHRELEPRLARQICRSLIVSALQALRSPDAVLAGIDDVA